MKKISSITRKIQLILDWILFIYGDLLEVQPKPTVLFDAPEILERLKLERAVRNFNLKKRGVR
jgi:hypothetical protein